MIIDYYKTAAGKEPFVEWFEEIKDTGIKTKIITKVKFLQIGNFSQCKPVGDEVFERKLYGIRLYFLKYQNAIVILLLGGEKDKQQQRDIDKAKEYAKDYFDRQKRGIYG
ncbi:MAG: type II toxin-antitoxin system RelE/ParE family toxin [Elusimicrobiota bacterium]|jgi:putative addiction module killer protein|nr:type II toxin-antitoxin system RelE/ParE family toxin [Elusimicrobiota bacterium]